MITQQNILHSHHRMSLVSIISVNYNQPQVTVDFLHSIKSYCAHIPVELILTDNSPQHDYEPLFKTAYPDLIYLKSHTNTGFAGGNNMAIQKATGDYILLLNNDTEITMGFVETMVREMKSNPSIGLLSPLIKYFDDTSVIQYAGFTPMNYITARNTTIGYKEKDTGQYNNDSREVGFCHGAAVMCRRNDLLQAGLMDESYFLYYEELDWCEKFKRIGKKIWFTGKTFIYHKESMSVGKQSPVKTYFLTRNRMLYIRRNTGIVNRVLFAMYYSLIGVPKQFISHLVQGRMDLAMQTLRGFWWNVVHSRKSNNLGYRIT